MSKFAGFPGGRLSFTPLPDLFFSELLPQVDNLTELKVTLHVLWLLNHRPEGGRQVALPELLADGVLMSGLLSVGTSAAETLREGLQRAVARGTLLRRAGSDRIDGPFYVANDIHGRRLLEQVQLGETELRPPRAAREAAQPPDRPNIFVLYEQNIGLLQPLIVEELKDAEMEFPPEWIEEAFHIAVEQNVRNWKYVRRILERWQAEGKDEGKGEPRDKTWYTQEESRRYIKR